MGNCIKSLFVCSGISVLVALCACPPASVEEHREFGVATAAARPCAIGEITDAVYEKLPRINGKPPRNGHLAGHVYPPEDLPPAVRAKYLDSVKFKDDGFPDFEPYAKDLPVGKNAVEVEGLTGSYKHDEKLANTAAGLGETPDFHTWHHVEDGRTMQLIPSDIHRSVGHTGGSAIIKGDYWTPCGQ